MKSIFKLFNGFMVVILALSLVSCAALKNKDEKKADEVSKSGSQDQVTDTGVNIELAGDSDSNKAGGLKTVYFPFDSSVISSDTEEILKTNTDFLKQYDKIKVQIEGHCDERGSVQYNLALGEKRAKSVKDYLVANGVSADRLSTVSYGKEKPLEMGHEESSWSKNRRGNFVVLEK
ncbi:MAG: peptidoglycan-associated lipoprotein Pal [Oligoflexia bacterium]|nr:peptidoglycan-associated lipoprotein Pal [Oligoflexia bacterium]